MLELKAVLKGLLLPPGVFIVGALVGLVLILMNRQHGRKIAGVSIVSLFLLSLPIVSDSLTAIVEADMEPIGQVTDEQAIVILSAGIERDAYEYDGPTLDSNSLARVRYGAYLQRKSKLPILVTGGDLGLLAARWYKDHSVADLMAATLRDEFQATVQWVEPKAVNTHDNARFSATMLKPEGIERIILVTHAWHMPRSVQVFEKAGFAVTPAPIEFRKPRLTGIGQWAPSTEALHRSFYAFHELIGQLWYKLRF